MYLFFFFFNDTATTEIYTLSLHDALPIYRARQHVPRVHEDARVPGHRRVVHGGVIGDDEHAVGGLRSEEHTSELQSQSNLVCRLLLEKKKKTRKNNILMQVDDQSK